MEQTFRDQSQPVRKIKEPNAPERKPHIARRVYVIVRRKAAERSRFSRSRMIKVTFWFRASGPNKNRATLEGDAVETPT